MNLDGINPAHVGVKRALNILQFIPKAHYPSLFWACVCVRLPSYANVSVPICRRSMSYNMCGMCVVSLH